MVLKKTHTNVFEQDFSEFSLQLDNPLHLHLFGFGNCFPSLCRHRFFRISLVIWCWIVLCKTAIRDLTFFAFFILLFKRLIKQISEPLHTKMIHWVQSRQLLNSEIKSGPVFRYRLEYLAVFFNPIFDVFCCQQFVVDIIRYLFRCFKFVDKIIRFEDVLATIAQCVKDIVNNLSFLLCK